MVFILVPNYYGVLTFIKLYRDVTSDNKSPTAVNTTKRFDPQSGNNMYKDGRRWLISQYTTSKPGIMIPFICNQIALNKITLTFHLCSPSLSVYYCYLILEHTPNNREPIHKRHNEGRPPQTRPIQYYLTTTLQLHTILKSMFSAYISHSF